MLKVANINIFWSNGSYEVPISFPPLDLFTDKPNANVVLNNIDIGHAVLEGQWNYAHINNSYYFLSKLTVKDENKQIYKYVLIRDLNYELYKLDNLNIYGELNKVTDRQVIKDNLNQIYPILETGANVELINIPEISQNTVTKITNHNYNPDEHQYVVATVSWNTFINHYKEIQEKNSRKTKGAILTSLPTTKIKNWQKILVDQYLNPLVEDINKNLNNYQLLQITNPTTNLMGMYQLRHPSVPALGTNLLDISQLEKIDLSGLKDIIPLHKSQLSELFNTPIDTFDLRPDKQNVRGYFTEAEFRPDSKPWENKNPSSVAVVFPLDNRDYGIDETLRLVQLDKSKDNTLIIQVPDPSITTELKKHVSDIDDLDRELRKYKSDQNNFFNDVWQTDGLSELLDTWNVKKSAVRWIPAYSVGGYQAGAAYAARWQYEVPTTSRLAEGLPKLQDERTYDYELLNEWINSGFLDTAYLGTFFDYHYFVCWGLSPDKEYKRVIAVREQYQQTAIVNKIKKLFKYSAFLNPENNKTNVLTSIYKHLNHKIQDNHIFTLKEDEIKTGNHLFNLVGTNYYLFLINGKASLIIKEIKQDSFTIFKKTYNYEAEESDKYSELINTKRYLYVYGKEYLLNNKTNSVKNLQITKLQPTTKINVFETLFITYNSPYTCIYDVNTIPRETIEETLSSFNAIEYEDSIVNKNRILQDLKISEEELRLQREKQDYELNNAWWQYNNEYTKNIVNTSLGAVTTGINSLVGLYAGGIAGGMMLGSGLNLLDSISGTIFKFAELNKKYEKLNFDQQNVFATRLIENHKLDITKQRLEIDNKRFIDKQTLLTSRLTVNERDTANQLKELWNMGDVFLKVVKPTNEQLHLLNEHYAHYGYDCLIPRFTLDWNTIKQHTNIWGFKSITNVNIKDPVIKIFIIGKFINGVKLIKPTFN